MKKNFRYKEEQKWTIISAVGKQAIAMTGQKTI